MIRFVSDWKNAWTKLYGNTTGFEVIIYCCEDDVYIERRDVLFEGSFCDIPADLLGRKVLRSEQICASSVPERDGAFVLLV